MDYKTNIALSGAIAVGAFVLGLVVERAFVHKGFLDETRKMLKRRLAEFSNAT